jgi:hypothetical protein
MTSYEFNPTKNLHKKQISSYYEKSLVAFLITRLTSEKGDIESDCHTLILEDPGSIEHS